jgi:hypothetical protein
MRLLPPWIGRGLAVMYGLHDVAFIAVAIFGALSLPPSVEATLTVYAWVWIVSVGTGAVCGLIGTVMRNVRMEVLGCGLMCSGLLVYAAALLARAASNGTPAGLAAAGIFLAAGFSMGARIFVMFAAIYLREPK